MEKKHKIRDHHTKGHGGILLAMALGLVLIACAGPSRTARAERGEALFKDEGCYGCHMVGKFGTPIGPDLSRIGARLSEAYLRRWLHDPEAQRPTAHMPKLELTGDQVEELAAYLASLR